MEQQRQLQADLLKAGNDKFLHLCHVVFKQYGPGAEWLQAMKESLIERLPVADLEKSPRHADFREGQNSIIRLMHINILKYEQIINENARKTQIENDKKAQEAK